MPPKNDRSPIFSIARRRELEQEKRELRRRALAHGKRVLGRLAHERRLNEVYAALFRAELEAVGRRRLARLAGADLANTISLLRERLRQLAADGALLVAAAEEVAGAIEETESAGAVVLNLKKGDRR